MKIRFVANEAQQHEIESKEVDNNIELYFFRNTKDAGLDETYDATFYLDEFDEGVDLQKGLEKHIFINSVTLTLQQQNLPANYSRINGWPGFLQRACWEVASNNKTEAAKIFEALNWKIIFVKDEPGLIAARVISMIINEAFFALEEGVSTKDEIDLAMKLGTNYPYGPFEWQQKIGLDKIYKLLTNLSVSNKRYYVSTLLKTTLEEEIHLL